MSIELPKDAEGREIPLDTECLYMKDGTKQNVESFTFTRTRAEWSVETNIAVYNPADLYLTPTDSWGKLLEDLGRAGSHDDTISPHCRYLNPTGKCSNCMAYPGSSACTYQSRMAFRDIFKRIRRLRGGD